MIKPTVTQIPAHTVTEYYWHDIWVEIANKLGLKNEQDLYDITDHHRYFYKWCDMKGYGQQDPAGKDRGSSQIWFKEFQTDPDGMVKEPPYVNLWHFAMDTIIPEEMNNDSTVTMYRFDGNITEKKHGVHGARFLNAYNEILDELDPDEEGIEVHFSW